ncbi:MAG: amidohydrolase family protein [Gemmatimonadales bacterium]|nr:amidohydrolase family protein [Candidatus Palauibacter irciniicola]MYC19194.1 amidohydrolase family protein [Gemmatimonadales bacterium]
MTARITQRLATTAAVALLGVATLFPSPVAAQDLALADAVILNPADESVRRGVLLIEAGRISDVVTHIPPEFAGRILDVEGRFVVPALADLHIHSWGHASPGGTPQLLGPERAARAALYNGVAFILDLFSPEQMILEFRDRQRDEGAQGAVLLAAGPCFTATNGHCSQFGTPTRIVDTPDEARHEVADLAASAPDVVKVVYDHQVYGDFSLPTIDLPTLGALIETAREHGLKTIVHVGTWQDMREAAAAGADAVTHTPSPAAIPSDLAEELAQAVTSHIPTLVWHGDLARLADESSFLEDPLLVETISSGLLEAYRDADGWPPWVSELVTRQRTLLRPNREAVRALAHAGVPMLTGTDAGNIGAFHGYSVHRELQLLVGAGLSEWSALRSATTNAARFLDRDWGVAPGDEATLLVLDASPIESILNTKQIHLVIQRGAAVDRESLRNQPPD